MRSAHFVPFRIYVFGAALVAAFWPAPSSACECAFFCNGAFPAGPGTVPTNTLVWQPGDFELRPGDENGPTGDAVAMTFTQVRTGDGCIYRVGHPVQQLSPQTRYHVVGGIPSAFTTGGGPDTAPPPIPEVTSADAVRLPSGQCGPGPGIQAWATFDITADGALRVITADPLGDLDTTAVNGSVTEVTTANEAVVGRSDCGGNRNLSGAMNVRIQVGAFSAAGVFSGWSQPYTQWLPPAVYACACGQTGNGCRGLAAVVFLVAVRHARRRVRPSRLLRI